MGNQFNQFCQGCNEVFSDGKSFGENDLTQRNNAPILKINNPFIFNNKTTTSYLEPQTNNESFININNNNNTFILNKFHEFPL